MKKTILFLLVILACQVMCAGTIDFINEDPEKIELEEDDNKKGNDPQRSIQISEAFLNRTFLSLELKLYNIGIATIMIINSYGEVICSASSNTTLPVTLSLALPNIEDTYVLEIVSSNYSAMGTFCL